MTTMGHPSETDLALYSCGDAPLAARLRIAWHLRSCRACADRSAGYRGDRKAVETAALAMPPHVDWDRLSSEMSANIRVGLAAGECVAREPRRTPYLLLNKRWQQGMAVAGLAVLLVGAWWFNMPASQHRALSRVGRALLEGRAVSLIAEPGTIAEVSPLGVQLKEDGNSLAVTNPSGRPVAVSVSLQGAARARYVDADTGQMTITTVYVQ